MMGSLSTRRVVRRSAPAKITVMEGQGSGEDSSDKENMVNCTLYSLFETHYRKSNSSPCKGHPQARDAKGKISSVLQTRKRSLNDRIVPFLDENALELSPPELTTSDTFKPAKRTLPSTTKPGEEGDTKLPQIRTPTPETRESCDVLVSSPTELKKLATPKLPPSRGPSSGTRDLARKTPTHGRRLSIVKVSIARDGGGVNNKKDGNSTTKKLASTADFASGSPVDVDGKDMVFSAKKRTSIPEQPGRVQAEVERARSRVLERRKSIGVKANPVAKHGIGSFGGKPDNSKKDCPEKASPIAAQQTPAKAAAENIKTRKLAMVLKSEQRLAEKNEQYGIQLRQVQDQLEGKEEEVGRLRNAALFQNNLINRQSEEIRELRFRLKETFNENSDVRQVCVTLERELRKTRESLRMEKMNKVHTKPHETKFVSLTSQFKSMAICTEPRMIESCIEEGQEDAESQEESEVNNDIKGPGDSKVNGVPAEDTVNRENSTSNKELPKIQNDVDVQLTLQDLQEMVMHEEDLLKERCANALTELHLPLTPFLNSKGSLDVGSLKAMLASISSKKEILTAERISSIQRLSAWLGST